MLESFGYTNPREPPLAYELLPKGLDSGSRIHLTVTCSRCKTRYRYDTDYEFLVGGTEDEEHLHRLAIGELIATAREAARAEHPWWNGVVDTLGRFQFALEG